MQALARRLVDSTRFQRGIVWLIVLNAVVIGLETLPEAVARYGTPLNLANGVILWIFVAEAGLELTACWPRPGRYFRDAWNVFDFTIVAFSLLPITSQFAMVARLMRLLRVMRLVSTIPVLRVIVATRIRSLPSMAHVVLLAQARGRFGVGLRVA